MHGFKIRSLRVRNMKLSWLNLEDKVAVVTGGGSGIGRACCLELARNGARVCVADIMQENGEAVLKEIESIGGMHSFVKTDVTSLESVIAMASAANEKLGGLDILVNNAGVNIPALLVDPAGERELTEQIWDRTASINQKGAFLCAQAAIRCMIQTGTQGVVINMASESGLEGSAGQSIYAATKAALYSLTRSWAKEVGTHGIRVVGLAPGILEVTGLRTEAYEEALAYTRGITAEALRENYGKSGIPLGRPGTLQEVANAVCFLASERASYAHGTILNLSGGKSRA
jgi:sorbitol-6-phosphate 2-dehydrogenase